MRCFPHPLNVAPPYPCERPDLLQCLTCFNQPTDEDCNINGYYEFCDGVEDVKPYFKSVHFHLICKMLYIIFRSFITGNFQTIYRQPVLVLR